MCIQLREDAKTVEKLISDIGALQTNAPGSKVEKGVVVAISVRYANGLQTTTGTPGGSHKVSLTLRPADGQKIIACSIETGRWKNNSDASTRITPLRPHTNRGPDLEGHSVDSVKSRDETGTSDGVEFEGLKVIHFDPLLVNAHIKGLWGKDLTTNSGLNSASGVYRLAPIWGDEEDTTESERHLIDCEGRLDWKGGVAGRSATIEQSFNKPLRFIPTVIYGFRYINVAAKDSLPAALSLPSVTEWGFSLALKSFLHPTWNLEANVMVLPNGAFPFQNGFVDASDTPNGRKSTDNASIHVTFTKAFAKKPQVSVWFTEISQPKGQCSLKTFATDTTPFGMRINIETCDGREFDGARVPYLAYPGNSDAIKGGSTVFGPKEDWKSTNWPGGAFKSEPWVFTAINMIDVGENDDTMDIMVGHQY